jgi:hypothetical protein
MRLGGRGLLKSTPYAVFVKSYPLPPKMAVLINFLVPPEFHKCKEILKKN